MNTMLLWGGLALLAAALSYRVSTRMRRRRGLMRREFASTPCRRCDARN